MGLVRATAWIPLDRSATRSVQALRSLQALRSVQALPEAEFLGLVARDTA